MSDTTTAIDHDAAITFLMRDGDLSVPCSPYGERTSDCAEVAWRCHEIYLDANGQPDDDYDSLDFYMGLVVNGHEDVAYLLATYGDDDERDEWSEYAQDDES